MKEHVYEGHEIPIYSVKTSEKLKDIKARLLFNLYVTSVISPMVEKMCNIVLFLMAADWFSPIFAHEFFCI